MNTVIMIGNIGDDPKIISTRGDKCVLKLRLATSRPKYDKDGVVRGPDGRTVQETDWHSVICFNSVAKTVDKYSNKGQKVAVPDVFRTTTGPTKRAASILVTRSSPIAWSSFPREARRQSKPMTPTNMKAPTPNPGTWPRGRHCGAYFQPMATAFQTTVPAFRRLEMRGIEGARIRKDHP